MSARSESSDWVAREVRRAEEQGKEILPLLLDGTPFFELNTTQHEAVVGGALPSEAFMRHLEEVVSTSPLAKSEVSGSTDRDDFSVEQGRGWQNYLEPVVGLARSARTLVAGVLGVTIALVAGFGVVNINLLSGSASKATPTPEGAGVTVLADSAVGEVLPIVTANPIGPPISLPASASQSESTLNQARCDGKPATVNIALGEVPTDDSDVVLGTDGDDDIHGDGGDDFANGGDGTDTCRAETTWYCER